MNFLRLLILLERVRYSISVVEYVRTQENLQAVPGDISPSTEVLNLATNGIMLIDFLPLTMEMLRELDLRENLLSEFPNLSNCSSIERLFLENNKISYIAADRLNALTKLEWLVLASNDLHLIPDVPGPGGSMNSLALAYNNFTSIPVLEFLGGALLHLYMHHNAINSLHQSHLQPLKELQTLGLSHNCLQQIPAFGNTIPNVKYLMLASNPDLSVIPPRLFPTLPSVELLNLRYTGVTTVPMDICLRGQQASMQFELDLRDTPLHCDWGFVWLKLAEQAGVTVTESPTCHSPQALAGKVWNEVTLDQLAGQLISDEPGKYHRDI